MKRVIAIAAALCAACGSLWAQDTNSDTSEDYVLKQAREKYAATAVTQPATTEAPATTTETQVTTTTGEGTTTVVTIEISQASATNDGDTEEQHRPYSPFVISFVPGLSFPWGICDTSLSGAAIGAATGSVTGVQGAGVFNITDGNILGLQGAGIFNITTGTIRGAQGAGIFNIAGGDILGLQAAGLFNIANGNTRGAQGAGLFNIANGIRGIQAAGIFNIADHVSGIQAAGICNFAQTIHGVQAAGIVNAADEVHGAMIGLVNIADELDGVAIGLVNIIGNGIHDIAIDYQFASETAYATYRSGTPFLYAAFSAGQPAKEFLRTAEGLTVGTAIGHRFNILFLTADIELGAEMPIDPISAAEIVQAIKGFDVVSGKDFTSWFGSFGTLRASFGFGKRKGFGPYLGIKADFAPTSLDTVPAGLRSAFGSAEPYTMTVFGTAIDIWPKWFLGIKF